MSIRARGTAGPRVARAAVAVVMTLLSAGVVTGLTVIGAPAASAATATINCDQVSHRSSSWKSCRQLQPTASCVFDNGDGTFTAAVGYVNPTSYDLYAAAAAYPWNNYMTATGGSAANPGHISTFSPGTSTTAFTVTWSPAYSGDPITWYLMGHTLTVTTTSVPACPSSPVPVLSSITVVGVGFAVVVPVGWVLLSRRSTRLGTPRAA